MNIYAYFTIFDAIAKLFIVYMVQTVSGDKLIIYAFLVFGVSVANMLLYRIYTYRTFPVCRLNERKRDKLLLKEIFSFMSWSLAGQAAVVGTNQGVSVLVTYWFFRYPQKQLNTVVNAAAHLLDEDSSYLQLPPELNIAEAQLRLARQQAQRSAQIAREAEQRKNDLIVYLAHDLKTPLTSVIGR